MTAKPFSVITWLEKDQATSARWRSEAGLPPHGRLVIADDRLSVDAAWKLAGEGTAMLWRGDWQNARHLLQGLSRRADRHPRSGSRPAPATPAEAFEQHRRNQGRRAQALAMLLVPLRGDYSIPLRRAQDVRQACVEAYGPPTGEDSVVSLRELLAVVSAHEWRKKGVPVPAVEGRIYPHYGVFSPVRGEYVDLVAKAPLPANCDLAFDIGTGSGVIAAILARRGVRQVVATDMDERALACASENVEKLGLTVAISVVKTDLFPPGRARLVVCNPPWLPAQPTSPVEYAVYDPESRMLRGFLGQLAEHLEADGEGWLIISDIAELLGLRSRQELLGWIEAAGLKVIARLDTRPKHPKAQDAGDPLHVARAAEVTSLWRLARADGIK
ncbi:MAG: class I SAM-dependent methyltransferase [Gammaproteobacteria bacterium]|nr:class I SAM-dependent methyltransferase [Gammaproteobacteria bacterium]MBU1600961.1 class I SAM-dependent methyltransferase [Gammaproteobacteria bacterium]MBU2434320.1 class I SAM-dependent methyltransferase [Gammaproteobacteria bacterium]MBU2450724.1 class I SAM-dependent methyltransferase [Gammaproteobacteria bacterium]